MVRKRKTPLVTTDQGLIPIHYATRDFEERNKNVIDFTNALRSRNRDVKGRELAKDEVTQEFAIAIFRLYPTADPRCFELLGQVSLHSAYISDSVRD